MKILFSVIAVLIYLFLSFEISAKTTSGNSIHINAVGMRSSQTIIATQEVRDFFGDGGNNNALLVGDETLSGSGVGYGAAYKYSFSMKEYLVEPFDRAFISPGIFYDDVETTDSENLFGSTITLGPRYGFSADIGFDFDYGISWYFTNGISSTNYEIDWSSLFDSSLVPSNQIVSGNSIAYFYGMGMTYSPIDSLSLILEYTQQENTLEAKVPGSFLNTGILFDKALSESKFLKFGISLNF